MKNERGVKHIEIDKIFWRLLAVCSLVFITLLAFPPFLDFLDKLHPLVQFRVALFLLVFFSALYIRWKIKEWKNQN